MSLKLYFVMQSQKAVTAHLKSEQILPSSFAMHYGENDWDEELCLF